MFSQKQSEEMLHRELKEAERKDEKQDDKNVMNNLPESEKAALSAIPNDILVRLRRRLLTLCGEAPTVAAKYALHRTRRPGEAQLETRAELLSADWVPKFLRALAGSVTSHSKKTCGKFRFFPAVGAFLLFSSLQARGHAWPEHRSRVIVENWESFCFGALKTAILKERQDKDAAWSDFLKENITKEVNGKKDGDPEDDSVKEDRFKKAVVKFISSVWAQFFGDESLTRSQLTQDLKARATNTTQKYLVGQKRKREDAETELKVESSPSSPFNYEAYFGAGLRGQQNVESALRKAEQGENKKEND